MKYKLATSQRPSAPLDQSTVTGNCVLTYRVGIGPERVVLLCHRARTEAIGIVPVRSLLGVTLIGMSIGQSAPLILADCSIERVRVLAVKVPSKASRTPRTGAQLKLAADYGDTSMEFFK